MNLNELIENTLSITGLEVEQDEYTGKNDKYIIFTYEDEAPDNFGDNRPLSDTVYLQIQLITPKHFDYFHLKKQIRNSLEAADFSVTLIRNFLGSVYVGTEKTRQTVFEANYTVFRKEEE